ncbi:hypothetical protein [Pedobacter endophyticus]|nr:hypothetical protein [Pedobacter endophyticus]
MEKQSFDRHPRARENGHRFAVQKAAKITCFLVANYLLLHEQ